MTKDDLISRQAAIDALAKFVPYAICDESTESYTNGLTDAYNLILQLPSAQPTAEPVRHGKWIKADSQQYFRKHYPCFTCSECSYKKDSQKKWNYCPNCGAKMDEEKENTHD